MQVDHFHTIALPGTAVFRDRGSKFIGHAFRAQTESEVEVQLSSLRNKHPKARHICYAYRLSPNDGKYRINDDGEPSGSAGRPIFDAIRSFDLYEVHVVVIRYFGGTKLGVPGLINAYKQASIGAVENSHPEISYLMSSLKIEFEIEQLGKLYDILKDEGVTEIDYQHPDMFVKVRQSTKDEMIKNIIARYHGYSPGEISDNFTSHRIRINPGK